MIHILYLSPFFFLELSVNHTTIAKRSIGGSSSYMDVAYQVTSCSQPHLQDCGDLLYHVHIYHVHNFGILSRVRVFLNLRSEKLPILAPNWW